jgi:hypothetical protein
VGQSDVPRVTLVTLRPELVLRLDVDQVRRYSQPIGDLVNKPSQDVLGAELSGHILKTPLEVLGLIFPPRIVDQPWVEASEIEAFGIFVS